MPDFDAPHMPPTDRRRSRDPADHLGFIVQSIALWHRRGHLAEFEADELLSIAFIEAEHLLRVKYDPTRATVTSFLSGWLFGRVQYAALRSRGNRRRANRWHRPVDLDPPATNRTPDPSEGSAMAELVERLEAAGYSTEIRFHDDAIT